MQPNQQHPGQQVSRQPQNAGPGQMQLGQQQVPNHQQSQHPGQQQPPNQQQPLYPGQQQQPGQQKPIMPLMQAAQVGPPGNMSMPNHRPQGLPPGMPPMALSLPGMPPPGLLPPPGMPPRLPIPGLGLPGMPLPGMPGMPPMGMVKQSEWSEHRTSDGRVYFYNSRTMQSTWERPKEMDQSQQPMAMPGMPPGMAGMLSGLFPGPRGLPHPPMRMATPQAQEVAQKADQSQQPVAAKEEEKSSGTEESREESQEADRSKPVASELVPGTTWCVVWTGTGKAFFFNPATRLSVWEKPEELKDNDKVDEIIENGPPSREEKSKSRKLSLDDADEHQAASKRPRRESRDEPPQSTSSDVEMKDEPLREPLPPAKHTKAHRKEEKAARDRKMLPLDERMKQFREMMLERGVSAFSTWEKELPKIVFDPRYLLLNQKERKQCFEKFVRTRADEERQERKNKMKEKKDSFKAMLQEMKVTVKTSFSEFAMKHGKEERFKQIEKMKERETIFLEYISELKKKEKETSKIKNTKLHDDFFELLEEQNLEAGANWRKVKSKIEDDPRYKAVESVSTKEDYFMQFMEELEKKENSDKEKQKAKMERMEASMRKRESEVREQQAEFAKAREKEKEFHLRDKAVQHFSALLTDMVRNSDVTWKETKRTLRKDHRWSMVEPLPKEEREKIFNDHISQLHERKREQFRKLLDETTELTLTSSWRSIKKIIRDDPRYSKFSSHDRKREAEFTDYLQDKQSSAKVDFRQLLKETHLITYKSKQNIENHRKHLKDIEQVLENDRRYLILECMPEERERLLMGYIDELHRRGPPPPPTATLPNTWSKTH
ncbi:predicted protein [Nematostella vectensis]|uniref:Transcription elongation regulator 1 n=1 Tax=Nematostella vectensis TaxID=45351 RepID=A7RZN2_NEMVE|nr:predicted protein [Nematostella vectensis]|eukprot:XP_001635193.1 predicted protein [Nematostella vectensis]